MGRKKKYDRDDLIKRALRIFREHGFSNTSTQMLIEGLGINRFSLYAEFESKLKLFEIVLSKYENENVERNFGPLEKPDAGIREIQGLFEFLATSGNGPAAGLGCLLCNTAVEFGSDDLTDSGAVNRYFNRISDAFRNALQNEQENGRLRSVVEINKEADYFAASTLGLFVLIRSKASPGTVSNAAEIAVEHLRGLTI
jgi:TetR/AcrR family transcriptional repressor of nem operon